MTEEEKKWLALEFFQKENDRLRFRPFHSVGMDSSLRRMEKRQAVFTSLAQQGITWQDLKNAYDAAFQRGQEEMLYFHLTFFYAASAIAYKEWFPGATAENVASFIRRVADVDADDHSALARLCLEETGLDAAPYDNTHTQGSVSSRASIGTHQRASRKDMAAIARMQKTGITEKDLAYERDAGYSNGWNSEFHYSACIAGLGITLHRLHGFDADAIESFVERVGEIKDEEIAVADILARCESETGVDVSRMAE